MLNWGPSKNIYDNWSKESYSLLDRGAVRYKKAFYTAVQRYKKKTAKNGLSRWFHLHRNFPRQYLRCLNINYVDINKNITDVQDWMQTQTLQKKFVSVFNEFYPWHTLSQKYMKTNTKAASDKDQKVLLAELYWHRSYHSNVMTSSSILLAAVFLCIRQRLKIVISRIILTSELP